MTGYRVQLDNFAGPMDLLLYLVRRQELDAGELRIAEITRQFLAYLEIARVLEIEPAAEFVVLAATLMELKSENLIPKIEEDDEAAENPTAGNPAADTPDARVKLIRQLLAYKTFKDAADGLERAAEMFTRRFGRPPQAPPPPENLAAATAAAATPQDLGGPEDDPPDPDAAFNPDDPAGTTAPAEMEVWDLLKAFVRLMEDTGQNRKAVHNVDYDDTPIEVHAERIRVRLEAEGDLTLSHFVHAGMVRPEVIGVFIAVLELAKQRIIFVEQESLYGEIRLRLRPPEDRGHAAHEAALAAAEAAKAAAEPAPDGAPAPEPAADPHEIPHPPRAPKAKPAPDPAADDDVDPDLLDDEIRNIAVPEIDLDFGPDRKE
jgi:segregation and condensation protein A